MKKILTNKIMLGMLAGVVILASLALRPELISNDIEHDSMREQLIEENDDTQSIRTALSSTEREKKKVLNQRRLLQQKKRQADEQAVLQTEQVEQRLVALEMLKERDAEAGEKMATRLLIQDPDEQIRALAAAMLDNADESPVAIVALVQALRDSHEEVRSEAMMSLKAIRNDLVENELKKSLLGREFSPEVTEEVRLMLDRYYLRFDPFANPLKPPVWGRD